MCPLYHTPRDITRHITSHIKSHITLPTSCIIYHVVHGERLSSMASCIPSCIVQHSPPRITSHRLRSHTSHRKSHCTRRRIAPYRFPSSISHAARHHTPHHISYQISHITLPTSCIVYLVVHRECSSSIASHHLRKHTSHHNHTPHHISHQITHQNDQRGQRKRTTR